VSIWLGGNSVKDYNLLAALATIRLTESLGRAKVRRRGGSETSEKRV